MSYVILNLFQDLKYGMLPPSLRGWSIANDEVISLNFLIGYSDVIFNIRKEYKALIKTETIKLNKPETFDNTYIENELLKLGISPLRWAIVKVDTNDIFLSVSHVLEN